MRPAHEGEHHEAYHQKACHGGADLGYLSRKIMFNIEPQVSISRRPGHAR